METIQNLNPRNPLSIIAIFVSFCYLTISIVISLNITYFSNFERSCLISFICFFPILIFIAFIFLVIGFHEHLYAPKDFRTDNAFYGIMANENEISQKKEKEVENNYCFTSISTTKDRISKLNEYESIALQYIERKYSLFLRRDVKVGNFIFDAIGISSNNCNYLIEVKVCPDINKLSNTIKRMANAIQGSLDFEGCIPMLVVMDNGKNSNQMKLFELKKLYPSLVVEIIEMEK